MGGGGAAANPLRFVTPRNFLPVSNGVVPNPARLSARGTIPLVFAADSSELVLSYNGWYLSGSGPAPIDNPFTVVKVAIQKDGVSGSVPFMFDGSRSITVNPGDYDRQYRILPSEFGLSKFTEGDKYRYRFEYAVTTGQRMPTGVQSYTGWGGLPSVVSLFIDPATTNMSPVDSYGNMTFSTGWDNGYSTPVMPFFLGRGISDDIESTLGLGDSITAEPDSGFVRALFDADGVSNPRAGANFGRGGSSANLWTVNPTTSIWMQTYLQYVTTVIPAYGTNAFLTAPGFLELEKTSLQAIWDLCDSYGVSRIIQPPLIPRTIGNITTPLNSAWASGGGARQYNDWLLTQSGRVINMTRNSLRAGSDPATDAFYQWVNGSVTTDFTHPITAGKILDAADYRAVLAAYLP